MGHEGGRKRTLFTNSKTDARGGLRKLETETTSSGKRAPGNSMWKKRKGFENNLKKKSSYSGLKEQGAYHARRSIGGPTGQNAVDPQGKKETRFPCPKGTQN